MSKSRDAFRTISEVSETLDTPAHVLRFWESKFTQVKPVKRAGGRRYYRPADLQLLAGIKKVLHEDGMTIKGAQKLMREQGVKGMSAIGQTYLEQMTGIAQDDTGADVSDTPAPADNTPKDTAEAQKPDTVETAPVDTSDTSQPPAPTESQTNPTNDNVVTLNDARPSDPRDLTDTPMLDLGLDEPTAPEPAAPQAAQEPEAAPSVVVPDDPADSDSTLGPRVAHLLQKAPSDQLRARAEEIAPLLQRMRNLRDSISIR